MKTGLSTRTQKYEWLRQRPELWRGKKLMDIPIHNIVNRMKVDGLVSPSTYWLDVRVSSIIEELQVTDLANPMEEKCESKG